MSPGCYKVLVVVTGHDDAGSWVAGYGSANIGDCGSINPGGGGEFTIKDVVNDPSSPKPLSSLISVPSVVADLETWWASYKP